MLRQWFDQEFQQFGVLIGECNAHGASEIAACLRALCVEPIYLNSMCVPVVLHNLIDVIGKFQAQLDVPDGIQQLQFYQVCAHCAAATIAC